MPKRLLSVLAGLVVTIGAVLVTSAPAMASPSPPNGRFLIFNQNVTSNCLFNKSDHTSALWHCNLNFNDQLWDFTNIGADGLEIMHNANTGLCLSSNSKSNGAALTAQVCDSSNDGQNAAQDEWRWTPLPDGIANNTGWRVQNIYSGLCLLVKGGATGVTATQFTCETFPDQFWQFSTV
jgi:hypothetical protein